MRILMVSEDVPHPNLGGLGKHALALASALNRRGHEVDVLGNSGCPIEHHPEQSGPGRFIAGISGHARGWKTRKLGMYLPMRVLMNGRSVARAILAHASRYDIVHYHGHLPWVAAELPKGISFLQSRHDQGGDCMINTRFLATAKRCTSVDPLACAGCATKQPNVIQKLVSTHTVRLMRNRTNNGYARHPTIFVSHFLQQGFARAAGGEVSGTVLHNAVDTESLEAALTSVEPTATRQFNGIELFSAGVIAPHKGYGELLLQLEQDPLPDSTTLTIAGDGPLLADLRAKSKARSVSLLGWKKYADIVRMIARADAVVVPSVADEPCATTILEALALGRTVYALDRGGSRELQRYTSAGGAALKLFPGMVELVTALKGHAQQLPFATSVNPEFGATMHALAEQVERHYEQMLFTKRGDR